MPDTLVQPISVREENEAHGGAPQAGVLPAARGPVSEQLLAALRRGPHRIACPAGAISAGTDPEDLQLALYCCYELLYQGLPGVDDGWEWEPSLLELRSLLEGVFERQLRAALPACGVGAGDVAGVLWDMTRGDGFSLSGWLSGHFGHHEPDLHVRAAPSVARSVGRPPGRFRDELRGPDGPLQHLA